MANKGVTQDHVNQAADALVAAGERPTVERIRAFLGSGSPNNVTRLLDAWWRDLGRRLTAQHTKIELPQAPPEVAVLASQLWEQALVTARETATQALAADRAAVVADQATLAAERQELQQRSAAAQDQVTVADQARALAEARWAELQRLSDELQLQLRECRTQRDQAVAGCDDLEVQLVATREAHARDLTAASQERQQREGAYRAAEDRWLQEVDRARQELKATRAEQLSERRASAAREQAVQRALEAARQAATLAQQKARSGRCPGAAHDPEGEPTAPFG